MEFLTGLFDTSDFPARWRCGQWTPAHGWLHILSDVAVWAAYFAIPLVLGSFAARRRDLPFRRVFLLFVAFILLCGTTHLMEAVIFWWPAYRLAGMLKLLTAVVSWVTVLALVRVAPAVLAMRTPEELEREVAARTDAERRLTEANAELERRVEERTAELARSVVAVAEEKERLRTTLASIGDAVISTDRDGHVTYLNRVAETLTGWTNAEAAGVPLTRLFQIVNEDTRQPVENPALRASQEGVIVGLANHTILISKDGTERPIDDSAAPIRCSDGEIVGGVLVFHDITERKRAEALLAVQKTVLEMVATDAPLADVLSALAAAIEHHDRDLFCSVLLPDDDGQHVRVGAGPNLPAGYLASLDGQRIEPPYTGPCGMALHTGQAVVVADAAAEERWPTWREQMAGHGLRACRTTPVPAADGTVLGTFAVYSRRAGDPAPSDPNVLQIATRLAGIAIERRKKEAGLRQSEARFRELADAMPQIVYVTDSDGKIEFINRQWLDYTGQSDAGTADLAPVVHPADLPDMLRRWEQSAATGTPLQAEFRLRRAADREYRWFLTRTVPVWDAGGRVVQWYGTSTDIHEQKRAEAAVRASEQFHRLLVEAVPGMVWSATTADGLDYLSRRWEEYTGLTLGQIREAGWEAVHHPDEVAGITARFAEAAQSGRAFELEFRYRRRDGAYRWHLGRQVPVPDPDGRGLRWVGTLIDVDDRKLAEALVRKSEEKYRTLFESVDEGYCVIEVIFDPPGGDRAVDYRFLEVNPAFEVQSGLRDATGKRMLELVPAIEDHWLENYGRVALTGEPVRFADEYKTLNRWFDVYAFRVGDGESRTVAVLFTDITARRQAEQAVRDSEARHSFLVTLADTLRPLSDPTAVQAEASRVLGERLGASRVVYFEVRGDEYVVERDYAVGVPSVVGCHTISAFGPDQLALYRAGRTAVEADVDALPSRPDAEKAAFAGVRIRSYIGVPLVKNGVFVAGLAVHAARVRAWTPTEVAMVEDTAERTWATVERVRAEQEVARLAADAERQRRLFDTALSNTTDYTFLFDLGGRIVYANRALLALWGRTADQSLGKTLAELDYPADAEAQVSRNLRRVIETGEAVRDETPYTGPTGVTGHFEYILGPVLEAGQVILVAGSSRDITDRKRMEDTLRDQAERLREADRRKDEFLATLAHELRNPLAPIRNGLQVIRMAGANGTIEQARSMMERQLGQMVRLVDDLLDVSRVTTGKLTLSTDRLELRAVIDAAVETTRPVVEQAGHNLEVAVPDEPIFVDGDLTRLAQVVSNLLTNSAKYTHRGGHIRLTVERDGDSVVVSVKDDGIGIPPAMLNKVFVMFTQVDRTLEKTTGGLGIGLSLVKGLVEMHGGTIAARSEGEGKGSEFVVTLPVASPPPAPSNEADKGVEEVVPSGRRRVLVVDDNVDAADSLTQLLELLDNEVRTAYDGEAGVRAAESFRPDVVLMDIGMPKLNGYEACRRIREQRWGKDIVLVALTGWGQDGDRAKSEDAGFNFHLVKPVEFDALTKLLAGLPSETS